MTTAAIRKQLSNFMQVADDKKIRGLYALLQNEIESSERITVKQYNKEIDDALEEIKRGEIYSHSEVIKMSKKW